MKKNLTKFLAFAMAACLTVAMPIGVFADETPTVSITVDQSNEDAVFSAYRILNATNDGEKYAYTINDKYINILTFVSGLSTQEEIVNYISTLDADGIRDFADKVYAGIVDAGLNADAVSVDSAFTNVEQGYYLISESTVGSQPDSYSLIMLDTLGEDSITIETKEDVPTLEKEVLEKNDSLGTSAWQDGADYDIGDDVAFTLTGTLPANYYNYDTYKYIIHDTLSSGLTYNNDVVVVVKNGETSADVTAYANITEEDGQITISFDDLKTIPVDITTITNESKIVVQYTAKLNENAIIGSGGNPNVAYLEFSNNPYDDGTGKTIDDKVTVFTFKLDINKVDKDNNPLEGAGFTLYKFDMVTNDYVAVGEEISGVTTFTFKGLDSGQYKIVETTVPNGYNKANDIVFEVVAEYDVDSADPQLKSLTVKDETVASTFNIDDTAGTLTTSIVNLSGTELPSTGGIGTTIFYIVGGCLVCATVVVLITRKRMGKEENED